MTRSPRARVPRPPNVPAHRYGWIPDLPDQRDFLFRSLRVLPSVVPSVVDLRAGCSAIEDQGRLGSCTANALAGALEYLERRDGVPFKDLSRLFIYYNERVIEHSVKFDSGASLRDGMKTLVKQGVCSEKRWPYVISRFTLRPGAACYTEALSHQVTMYQRILSLPEMFACLADGFPFVFGFTVYESFESMEVTKTGVVAMPGPDERALGGHAVLAVGYDEQEKVFFVRNSWGIRWGQEGYFTMPFAYLEDRSLSDDFWTIRSGENL